MTFENAVTLIQQLGIPAGLIVFVCVMIWVYTPKIVTGHLELLAKTGDALEQMQRALDRSNEILERVAATSDESQKFMQQVLSDHQRHCEQLGQIAKKLEGRH